jgi:hypothetical protein
VRNRPRSHPGERVVIATAALAAMLLPLNSTMIASRSRTTHTTSAATRVRLPGSSAVEAL